MLVLPPPLNEKAGDLAGDMLRASYALTVFALAVRSEEGAALREERGWTWQGAETAFNESRARHQDLPLWDDLLLGAPFRSLIDGVRDLIFNLSKFQVRAP